LQQRHNHLSNGQLGKAKEAGTLGIDGNPTLGIGNVIEGGFGAPTGKFGGEGALGIDGNPTLRIGNAIEGGVGIDPITSTGRFGNEGTLGIDGNPTLGIGNDIEGGFGKLHFVMIQPYNFD
jgi:hypothetical protein